MTSPWRTLATILCVLGASSGAHAQAALGLATQVEADGFRLSEQTKAHVFGNLDIRFDSNPMLLSTAPPGDMLIRFRAGASVARPSDKLDLRLALQFDY